MIRYLDPYLARATWAQRAWASLFTIAWAYAQHVS